jgi:acetyl-CoA synthetase
MSATEAFRASRNQLFALRSEYTRAVAEFRWPDLGARFSWAVDWFDSIARDNDRPALVVVEEDGSSAESSFADLSQASDRLAIWLAKHGVAKGDPVVLMLGNQIELWEATLAVMKLGTVVMPTSTAVLPADLVERIARTGARHVICNASDVSKFDDVPADYTRLSVGEVSGWADIRGAAKLDHAPVPHPGTAPHDPLLLYFTSGTTSRPKLVEHTQVSYPVGHLTTMYWLGIRPGDVHLNISSPGWAKHAWSSFFAPWNAEATILVYNYTRFDPERLLGQLRTRRVNIFCAPPTVWRMLINADLSVVPSSLRELASAGEPLNPEVIEQVRRAWKLTIRDGFGQTETTAQVGNTPESEVRPGSMGRALPGVPIAIVDPVTGQAVKPPGEGEICIDLSVKPLPLMTGYLRDTERNAEAMAGSYCHTGDVASIDIDGYITFIGRTDDVFKASDYKISPFELESVLIKHPAVAEAAVVPAPDPVRLAVPKAYVALAPGHEPTADTAKSILKHAREELAPWQRVRRVEFADLPKTISGKIRRVDLRQRESEIAQGGIDFNQWRDDEFDA